MRSRGGDDFAVEKSDELIVNITIFELPRSVADKIVDAAAEIAGRVSVSMETIEPQNVRQRG